MERDKKTLRSVSLIPKTNDRLEEVLNRIGRMRTMTMKVLSNNIEEVKEHDNELGTGLERIASFTKGEYTNLQIRLSDDQSKNWELLQKFTRIFTRNRENLAYYETFQINAIDTLKESEEYETFDLLVNKIKSKVRVERKLHTKTIISEEMFNLLYQSYKTEIS